MSEKPNRPVPSILFPVPGSGESVHSEFREFDKNKDLLECEIAGDFVINYNLLLSDNLILKKSDDELADIVLINKNSEEIYLQIVEIVDKNRLELKLFREKIIDEIWKRAPELKQIFKGVKLSIGDTGDLTKLCRSSSKDKDKLIKFLLTILKGEEAYIINFEQINKGYELNFSYVDNIHINIRFLRFMPRDEAQEVFYMWNGTRSPVSGATNYLVDTLKLKLNKYSQIDRPFWLLLYSTDAMIFKEEIDEANKMLLNSDLFSKVFLLRLAPEPRMSNLVQIFPEIIYKQRNVFPKLDDKCHIIEIRADEFYPKWNDKRFKKLTC